MLEAKLKIDLMELADLGQPTKIAHAIHKQLREQFGTVPRRSPLEGIAKAVGIVGIKLFDTTEFEGTLLIKDGAGAIGLRRGLRGGRRSFTLGHEIGHFLVPNHRLIRPTFECNSTDINKRRTGGGNLAHRPPLERIEIEANEFAAALLVPMPEFRAALKQLSAGCDIGHVRTLADAFAVSHEFMAQLYVANAPDKAAIVIAHNAAVKRVIVPTGFPYLGLTAGSPLPLHALARNHELSSSQTQSVLCEAPTHRWLEERGSVSAIYEQVLFQQNGWTSTLIVLDEEETDDDYDDRDWNRGPRST